MRHFHLFEIDPIGHKALLDLKDSQPERDKTRREPKRDVKIYLGDFNNLTAEILDPSQIPAKEAAFCLLDQRTFECHWSTVASIAHYKSSGHKIELFYFLPNSWLDRAISGLNESDSVLLEWVGTKGLGKTDFEEERPNPFCRIRRSFQGRIRLQISQGLADL